MSGWEKLKITSSSVAAVLIPIALVYIGNDYSKAIKERELQGRFVELAVDILREEPVDDGEALRKWATDVIDEYSGVKLTKDARSDLVNRVRLPGPATAMPGPWIVVMGADQEFDGAQYELKRAQDADFASAKILFRDEWYRTVVPFSTRAEATASLDQISALRKGAYIRQLDTWCRQPEPSTTGDFEICQP